MGTWAFFLKQMILKGLFSLKFLGGIYKFFKPVIKNKEWKNWL